ncbi:MAG TPA: tripartite tricarboxylate transporter substrate-binding protein, partial [Roseateles sp.]|nr:tripartite tricarboxylate transporter substrate-binding protein [Roseateles sp.]
MQYTVRKPSARPVLLAALALALLAAGQAAPAQPWPSKPIRLVIGFAPGGAADYVARTIADPLGRALGQTVTVDNRAGAGSSLAADFVAKAPADGYTLLIASPSSISVNPALNPRLSYGDKDLLPV